VKERPPQPADDPRGAAPFSPPLALRPTTQLAQPEPQTLEKYRTLGLTLLLSFLGVLVALGIGYAHYWLGHETHRLVKVLLAIAVVMLFLTRPPLALGILPFTLPYMTWLPKSPVPMLNAMNLLIVSMAIGWIGRTVMTKGRFLEASPWNVPLSLFLGWTLLSWLRPAIMSGSGKFVAASLQSYWAGVSGILLFYIVFNTVRTKVQVRRLALLFCIGAALGLIGLLRESASLGGGRRVSGGLGQENDAGAFFALAALFTVGMLTADYRGWFRRLALLGSLVASAVAVVLPASRGAMVGFLAGALPQVIRGGVIWILILVLLVVGFVIWAPDYVMDRLRETSDAATVEDGGRYDALNTTAGGRLDFWKAALQVIVHNPIIGVGWERMNNAMEPYLGKARPPHNLYLELAGESGIPGVLLLFWLFIGALLQARPLFAHPGFPRGVALGYTSAILAFLVSNLFGGRFFTFSIAGSVSVMTAILFRTRILLDEDRRRQGQGLRVADAWS
jgi:O-antigen ligase